MGEFAAVGPPGYQAARVALVGLHACTAHPEEATGEQFSFWLPRLGPKQCSGHQAALYLASLAKPLDVAAIARDGELILLCVPRELAWDEDVDAPEAAPDTRVEVRGYWVTLTTTVATWTEFLRDYVPLGGGALWWREADPLARGRAVVTVEFGADGPEGLAGYPPARFRGSGA